MLALSIRQPWAWLILHGGKDIENRDWSTKVRGRILIHASKGMTGAEFALGVSSGMAAGADLRAMPILSDIPRGGIVGSVEIVDCVRAHPSPWFAGRYGFLLRDPQPLPFLPWPGQLGFFDVPASALDPATPQE